MQIPSLGIWLMVTRPDLALFPGTLTWDCTALCAVAALQNVDDCISSSSYPYTSIFPFLKNLLFDSVLSLFPYEHAPLLVPEKHLFLATLRKVKTWVNWHINMPKFGSSRAREH